MGSPCITAPSKHWRIGSLKQWACRWPGALGMLALLMVLFMGLPVRAQTDDCKGCHKTPAGEKDGHAKLDGGCKACHLSTDGNAADHGKVAAKGYGLSAAQPALCVNCHNKPKFVTANRHTEPAQGCSGCHTTHSSKLPKMLKTKVPDVCYPCHAKPMFQGKVKHSPTAGGKCLECHDAHSKEIESMLKLPPTESCLECHAEVKEQPHVISGFSGKGHPLGDGAGTPVADPLRTGKRFSCASCHDPHRGEFPRLVRADTQQPMAFCQKCHAM
jgi:predicted CXXCH cytochrome family protein